MSDELFYFLLIAIPVVGLIAMLVLLLFNVKYFKTTHRPTTSAINLLEKFKFEDKL